jgi:CheY-like chemotaxis protein
MPLARNSGDLVRESLGARPLGQFLAVEDDMIMQRAIARAVAGDFHVSFADTGEQAIHALTSAAALPMFVLLDFMLPDMDGVQILQRLRADPRTKFLPVVVFSSVRDARHIRAAMEAGANSWVVKTNDPKSFEDCVQSICRYWTHLDVSS